MNEAQDQPSGVADSLPKIGQDQLAWAHLTARLLVQAGLMAKVVPQQGGISNWYIGESLAFRPPTDQRAPLGAVGQVLIEQLTVHDTTLELIENTSGLACEFAEYGKLDGDFASVEVSKDGTAIGEIVPLIKPPRECVAAPAEPLTMAFAAARLSLEDAGELEHGDLLILSAGPWSLINAADPADAAALSFEPATGRLGKAIANLSNNSEANPMNDPANGGQMTVPVALHLQDVLLTQDQLSQLAEAGSLELGAVTEGLRVSMSVGGLPMGKGEIVRVGDRFAVLLEDPAAGSDKNAADHAAADSAPSSVEGEVPTHPIDELKAEAD